MTQILTCKAVKMLNDLKIRPENALKNNWEMTQKFVRNTPKILEKYLEI